MYVFSGHRHLRPAEMAGPCSHDGLPSSSRDSHLHLGKRVAEHRHDKQRHDDNQKNREPVHSWLPNGTLGFRNA